jgi:two-component system cell cycle response regulator DivK
LVSAQPASRLVPHILIVDDFADGREMLAEYLTYRGFAVEIANGGREAVALAIANRPAVVLMDLTMPAIDGWEATRQLKGDPRTKDVIVIAVTAHTFTHDVLRARATGADGFVGKPFDIVPFVNAIAEIVEKGRAGLPALSTLAGGFDLSAPTEAS